MLNCVALHTAPHTMEQKMCPKRQSLLIFYTVKTPESVTKKVITSVMLAESEKF